MECDYNMIASAVYIRGVDHGMYEWGNSCTKWSTLEAD